MIAELGKVEIERENVQTVRGEDGIDIPTVQEQGHRNHSGQSDHGLTNNLGEMGMVNKF